MLLRLRWAILFTVFVAIVVFGVAFGVRHSFRAATRAQLEQELAQAAQLLAESNRAASNLNQGNDQSTDIEGLPYVMPIAFQGHINHVQWFDRECQKVASLTEQISSFVAQGQLLPVSAKGIDVIHTGQFWLEETSLTKLKIAGLDNQDGLYLVYSKPILYGNRVIGLAQAARSLEVPMQAMAGLWQALFLGGIGLTIGAFGVAWLVAGASLHPLRRITRTAESIRISHDFSRRLIGPESTPRHTPGDEVGQLAMSVDAMLSELRDVHQHTHLALNRELNLQRQFLADVSHELRTPLTTIYGNLRLLERDLNEEDRSAVLRDALDETERMSRLLHKLLQTARGEHTHPLNLQPVALAPLIEDVVRKVSVLSGDRHIVMRLTPHSQTIVNADIDAIKQVLLILIDNALKYTSPEGQISVTLRSDHTQAKINVLDTGTGMNAEQMQHIFERFYRGQDTQQTRGTGLGLAIAKELLNAHGGNVTVASQPGHGSEFTVTLPLSFQQEA